MSRFRWEEISGQVGAQKWFKVTNEEVAETPLGVNWRPSYCVLSERYRAYMDLILDFEVSSEDVWIVTAPESGTNWGSELVWLVMNDFNFDLAKSVPFSSRVPKVRKIVKWKTPASRNPAELLAQQCKISPDEEQTPPPYVIINHLPAAFLPRSFWTAKPKVFYVARNPKDTALSCFHAYKKQYGYSGTLEDFLDLYLEGLVEFGSQLHHVRDFWSLRNEPNVFFTTYEEIYADLGVIIQRAAKFLQKSVSIDQIIQSLRHLNVGSLKGFELETQNEPSSYRKREIGVYKTEMPAEYIKRFDDWIIRELPNCELAKTWLE